MIQIFTDTSANLPPELLRQYNLHVLPFSFTMNGEVFTPPCTPDGAFDGAAFFNAMRDGADVSTSMINVMTFCEAFEKVLAAGDDVIYVGMSSGISGSYHASELAADEMRQQYPERRIAVIDTKAASLGEGFVVVFAAKLRDEGVDFDEIVTRAIENAATMSEYFTVEDLKYLKKGGRISGAAALVGSILQIKPVLRANDDGQIVQHRVERGRKRALEFLSAKYTELVTDLSGPVGIAHCDCEEDAKVLEARLRERGLLGDVLTVCYEPVTGSHVGPGTVALFFYGLHR